jgi:hypothetical protein
MCSLLVALPCSLIIFVSMGTMLTHTSFMAMNTMSTRLLKLFISMSMTHYRNPRLCQVSASLSSAFCRALGKEGFAERALGKAYESGSDVRGHAPSFVAKLFITMDKLSTHTMLIILKPVLSMAPSQLARPTSTWTHVLMDLVHPKTQFFLRTSVSYFALV